MSKQEMIAREHDDETQIISARLATLKAETNWNLPVNRGKALHGAALQAWLLEREEEATRSLVERGIGYGLLKLELGHGMFGAWLKEHNIAPRTAQQAMKTAQMLLSISDSNAQRVALLPERKINVLARLPAEVVDDMFENGELDNIDGTSYETLQEIVQLRKQLDKAQTKNDRLSEQVGEQAEALKKQKALPETELYIKELRRAVLEETEALRVNAHQLQAILDQIKLLPDDTEQADFDSITHPLMFALQGMHSSVTQISHDAYNYLGDYKPDMTVSVPEISKAEAKEASKIRDQFMSEAATREKLRKVDTGSGKGNKARK